MNNEFKLNLAFLLLVVLVSSTIFLTFFTFSLHSVEASFVIEKNPGETINPLFSDYSDAVCSEPNYSSASKEVKTTQELKARKSEIIDSGCAWNDDHTEQRCWETHIDYLYVIVYDEYGNVIDPQETPTAYQADTDAGSWSCGGFTCDSVSCPNSCISPADGTCLRVSGKGKTGTFSWTPTQPADADCIDFNDCKVVRFNGSVVFDDNSCSSGSGVAWFRITEIDSSTAYYIGCGAITAGMSATTCVWTDKGDPSTSSCPASSFPDYATLSALTGTNRFELSSLDATFELAAHVDKIGSGQGCESQAYIDAIEFTWEWTVMNVPPFGGNASINVTEVVTNEYVCLNATAHDPEGDPITVRANVWNSTFFVNFTMVDDGSTSCDGASADTIYGVNVQSFVAGSTWNFSHLIVNDSNGDFNQTIINRRWNVTAAGGNAAPTLSFSAVDDDFASPFGEIDLTAFGTKNVFCNGTVTDPNGGGDIAAANATFFDAIASSSTATDSNATHYTNRSCFLSTASGNNKFFECLFRVRYFANNAIWTCNVTAFDVANDASTNVTNVTINELIALSVPATINFGTLEPGETSAVNKTNVTNAGNILIDLKIYGYANNFTTSDNALNCTTSTGLKSNISLYFLRYNVTDLPTCSNFGWTSNYWNLTNNSGNNEKEWPQFNLGKQTVEGTLMRNYTCWVLQLPPGVAGTCKGIISFTACKDGSCPEV